MEMKMMERFIDARHSTEGKVVAVALTALLACSTFTPSAMAMADEMDGATVSDKAMETSRVVETEDDAADGAGVASMTVPVEVQNASLLVDGRAIEGAIEVAAGDELRFAVAAEEGFAIESVTYNDEVLEVAGTQRTVSTEPVAAEVADEVAANDLYVIAADQLVEGAVLKVTAVAAENDSAASDDGEVAEGDEAPAEEAPAPADTETIEGPATVGDALKDAIVQGVTDVATDAVNQVEAPLLTLTEGESAVVPAALYQGGAKLGDRTIVVPLTGEVDANRVPPVADPVFNFGADRYVLNGKVGVIATDATPDQVKAVSEACNSAANVVSLRVTDGVVEYRTASADWTALAEGEQLVYFCSKLQGASDNKDMLNVAVEEDVLTDAVAGGHGVQVFVFPAGAEEGTEPLFTQTLYFDAAVTSLPQGVKFHLGDGVSYEVARCFISNDSAHPDQPYTAAEALALATDSNADAYEGTSITWPTGTYRAIAVFVNTRSYTASYDLNGAEGTAPQAVTAAPGTPVVLAGPSEDFALEGHYLAAWKLLDGAGNDLGIYEPGAKLIMPARDVVLKAQWEAFDGETFFTARFVWKDEDGRETEIERRDVTEVKSAGDSMEKVELTTVVTTESLDCPRGYAYAASGNAAQQVERTGRVITFYCEKNKYEVKTEIYFGDALAKTQFAQVPYGTDYAPAVLPTLENIDGNSQRVNYMFDETNPNNQCSITVTDDADLNVIKHYYTRDTMGVDDPDKGDGVPDKYQVKVTFIHDENSVWADGSDAVEKYAVVSRYNAEGALAVDGIGHLTEAQIPALTQTDGMSLDDACNWPTPNTDVAAPLTFEARFVVGNFPYTVRYVDDEGRVLDEQTGTAGFEGLIPYEMDRVIEGYAFDFVENANGIVTSSADNNVVTLHYGVDRLGVESLDRGDGVPDKYQAVAVFSVENGTWDEPAGSTDDKTTVVTLNRWNGDAWEALTDDELLLSLPGAKARLGYVPTSGAWSEVPSVDTLIGGETNEFVYSFVPEQVGYTVFYCKDSVNGEVISAARGKAAFEGDVPVLVENFRPVEGFTGEPTFVGPTTMGLDPDQNVLYVVYQRDAYTVRGTFAEGSHGVVRGNATQEVLFGRDSETMTFNADEGYRIASVVVNGESQPVANGQTIYECKIKRVSKDSEIVVRTAHMDEVVIEAPSVSKVYDGTALEPGAAQITGVPEGFTATAAVTGSRTNAGVSTASIDPTSVKIVDAAQNDVTDNFRVTTVDGSLTVEQARAIINVDDARKAAGTADPAFTGQVIGLVKGDVLAGLTYTRSVAGEMTGVYLNALTAEYDYNPNYRITVMPGTFTIGDAVLTPGFSQSDTPTGMTPTTPLGGSIQTVYRTAAAADRLARAVAGTDDISEPVYAEVLFDDSTPMVSRVGGETIEDDATALGAFDEPKCWVHWVMAMGLLLTIAYAGFVVARRLGYARKVGELDDNLTGGSLVEADQARSAAHHVGA